MTVKETDINVRQIWEAAKRAYGDDFVFIVTADHGGTGRGHSETLPINSTIPWIAWGKGVRKGEFSTHVKTYDTAATALWLLEGKVPSDWDGRPVAEVFNVR